MQIGDKLEQHMLVHGSLLQESGDELPIRWLIALTMQKLRAEDQIS